MDANAKHEHTRAAARILRERDMRALLSRLLADAEAEATTADMQAVGQNQGADRSRRRHERILLLLTRLHELSDDVLLSAEETAIVLDVSIYTLRHWRLSVPNHALKWQRFGRRVKYSVAAVKTYAHGEPRLASRLAREAIDAP